MAKHWVTSFKLIKLSRDVKIVAFFRQVVRPDVKGHGKCGGQSAQDHLAISAYAWERGQAMSPQGRTAATRESW